MIKKKQVWALSWAAEYQGSQGTTAHFTGPIFTVSFFIENWY